MAKVCLHCHSKIPDGFAVKVPPGGYAHQGCERRARLKVRAEYQQDAATACDAAAERLLTEIGNAEKYRDAFEDESEARMWVGRAADALRQAREFLTARARANIDAAKYRPGEDG